ncbi:MAG: HAD family hydrolase [Phycisphaerae bacterium]|nr:HAD family hydrolase [Phycisphaerae bacterium]
MSAGREDMQGGNGRGDAAVFFDMDGTLTKPCFDFDAIRREIGLPKEPWMPILEALELMPADERRRAEAILLRHEAEAAETCDLWEDAVEVVSRLRGAGLRTALLTRNSRQSAERVLARHGLSFPIVHTREDGPIKPAPDPVLAVCRQLDVPPAKTWVVGDYLFDLQSGNAAGARTVLMIGDAPRPVYADQADFVIRRLSELLGLLC